MLYHAVLPYLLCMLFNFITAPPADDGANSDGTNWTEVNVMNDEWKGIKTFLGHDLCKGDMEECSKFMAFVGKPNNIYNIPQQEKLGLLSRCETDKNLRKAVVCWVRLKLQEMHGDYRTKFEMQFWSDNAQVSHCRYATHTIYT
uniref:Uncharacterized protein n=1 Tax=Cacopsylla melanoneura TaxID=428564 RepID=A0A8D8LD48_9HEMI